jgi:16S rRNA (guanine(1405)-N(7))-methyltransferase
MKKTELSLSDLATEILDSRKYRGVHIPLETITNLVAEISVDEHDPKNIRKIVREKLHHIVAPYLGDPDYPSATREMSLAFQSNKQDTIESFCLHMLTSHASTRERIPVMTEFYKKTFSVTGLPGSILDIACGLNPFAFPWMGLPVSVAYLAYDIHLPRIELLNQFFLGMKMAATAIHRDIISKPPDTPANVAFIFKEAQRMEQRQAGCSRILWQKLSVDWLVITLPAVSLTGRHDLTSKHRKLVENAIASFPWSLEEFEIGGEMVFCIGKKGIRKTASIV